MRVLIAILFTAVFGCSNPAIAACAGSSPSWTATADESSVQTCLNNAAASGDTITVASGSFTVTTGLTLANKALTLVGGGIGNTNVTVNAGSNAGLNVSGLSAANFVRVTGFTFINQATPVDGVVQLYGASASGTAQVGFRFDHNRISLSGGRGMSVFQIYGLIDNNTFNATSSVQSLSLYGSSIGTDGGYTPWSLALSFGTSNAVYVEDDTFDYGDDYGEDCIDMYSGARAVVRHSTFHNTHLGWHGTDSGNIRSAFSVEVYSNTSTNDTTSQYRGLTSRGGTALIWNNTYGGTKGTWDDYTMMIYRASITGPYSWSYCDGTQWDIGSADFSNGASRTNVTFNTVARFDATHPDTVCTSGGSCTRPFDGAGTRGYPCRDQPGMTHDQVLAPVYAWNNTGTNHPVVSAYDGGCAQCGGQPISNWIAANRDFYAASSGVQTNATTPFNGTVNTGWGTLANRPTTCTPLTAYFASDDGSQGTLYQCATTNTWSSYYAPLCYPHPAQSGGSSCIAPVNGGDRLRLLRRDPNLRILESR